ncbi:PEP-CTERM system TPR-repeat protein PrsT [Methylomonas sp. EFPC3]|uniref:XrtA/PEP-CTERM system TPR-repeat protein PrsT n=1 Tax=Methylomonas sp. EFPC3 TaxID=3021710 RepID=UPI0024175248|nr:XrtA/PEP-CTERM system TPR-repeat protein PrsT [Methylomonas sp. EFPC3]WFP50913.1 PEP-CTERM system TPR-repeat protein PrsT [Methylomonas sp. EFPC3]
MRKSQLPYRLTLGTWLLVAGLTPEKVALADDILAGQYYEQALQAYREHKNDEAVIHLKNALQQNDRYVAAHILLGDIYLQQKSLSAAEVQLNLAKQHGVDPALIVENLAKLYTYQIRYNDLIKEIDPVRFSTELRPALHVFRGNAYLQLNQISEALNEFDSAAQIDPNYVAATVGRANALLKRGDRKGAEAAADKAMQIQPNDHGAWFAKGSIKHANMELEEALKFYDKAVELNPDHIDTRLARAGLLMDLKRDEPAKQDLQYVREKYPFEPKAAYLNAVLLDRNNQKDAAAKELVIAADTLASIKPEYLSAHSSTLMLSGLVNYSLQRFDLAAEYLRLYVKQFPEQSGPYKLLANVLLKKNEPEQAIELLRPIQMRNPQDQRLAYLLGNAFMQAGKHDMANIMFGKATAMSDGNGDLQTEIGLNRLAMGHEQAAIQDLETAYKHNPDSLDAGIPLVALKMSQGDSESALQIAQTLYKRASTNLTLLNLLGTTQVANGQYKQARQSFEKAIDSEPNFLDAQINLSKLDVGERKFDQARQRLQALSQKDPNNLDILVELAKVEQSAGRLDAANDWLERAKKLDSKSLPVLLASVDLFLKMGKTSEASAAAQAAEVIDKNNLQVIDALARSYLANNNREKALGVFIRMADQARFNVKQLYKAARYQIDAGDYFEAIKTLKKAVLVDEDHIPSQIALAEMELNHGKPVFAASRAESLLKRYPKRAFPHQLLGDIAVHDNNFSLANSHYQTAFELEPDTTSLMQLFESMQKTNQPDKAFNLLEQWVKKHPQDYPPMAALASELLKNGNFKEAEKYYDLLLKQFPSEPQFLNNLAYVYLNVGNNKALSLAEQAHKLAPDQAATNDTLGWILVNAGQAEQGLHYLRNAHSLQSHDPEIRYHIAVALNQMQRREEARQELEEALKANTAFNGHEQAKALLDKLR